MCVSEEELLSAMHQKTRYNIKIAQKHGVQVNLDERDFTESGSRLKKRLRAARSDSTQRSIISPCSSLRSGVRSRSCDGFV